jgi:poly-gamma-glutamate system protein
MFRPAIQKTQWLVGLAIFNILMLVWATNSVSQEKAICYDHKIEASTLMQRAMDVLKISQIGENGTFVGDSENDPNKTMLIGTKFSLTTTDIGDLDAKLTTLNPNMAAMIVDMFMQIGLTKHDTIAVTCTGSMPGANLALYAACEVTGVTPIIISSVGASQWGATNPYFTWLDMETILYKEKVFSHKSIASSIGGGGDTGKGLTIAGRDLLWESIYRNDVPLIQEDSLHQSINKRIEFFEEHNSLFNYQALINIGGGAASVGPRINTKLIRPGVSTPNSLKGLSGRSVIRHFARHNIPVIHLQNIRKLAREYNLPIAPIPSPEIGLGTLFSSPQYNLVITIIALFLSIIALVSVGTYSHNQIKKRMESYEPDSII